MENFLIIRLGSLGDIIHALPSLAALRKKFPKASISWVVEEKGKEILECVAGIDRIIPVRPQGWNPTKKQFWSEMSWLKGKISDKNQTALDFQGLVKSAFIAFLSRAQKRIGFHRKNLREPLASFFYTDRLEKIPENIHVISKNLRLLTVLGIEEEKYDFPLTLADDLLQGVEAKISSLGWKKDEKLVIFNVGAGWETKKWPAEKWIKLISRLPREGFFFLLLWGTEEEKASALTIGQQTNIPLAPFLTIKEVIALLGQVSLLISGDTFALQAACALARPVVGLFGPTHPQRNGPFRSQDKVAFHQLECSYCYKRKCSRLECMKKISAEEVAELSLQILKKND